MLRIVKSASVLLAFFICISVMIEAGAVSANFQASNQLIKKLEKTKTLSASFSQTVKDGKGNLIQQHEGQMWVSRPLKFRWETQAPSAQQIISNGTRLWVYDIDLEQATEQTLDKKVGNVPGIILSGDPESLTEHFVIQEETGEGIKFERFLLTPTDEAALFNKMILEFDGDKLVTMEFEDNLGQKTWVQFKKVILNNKLEDKLFQFSLPKGIDLVIEE